MIAPYTLSCVMIVQLWDFPTKGLGEPRVLKVFDHRLTTGFQENYRVGPWSEEIEQQYHQSIQSGRADEYMAHLNSTSDNGGNYNDPENVAEEVFLHYQMQNLYNKEVEVYRILGSAGVYYLDSARLSFASRSYQQVYRQSMYSHAVYQRFFPTRFFKASPKKHLAVCLRKRHRNHIHPHSFRDPKQRREN